MQLKKNKEDIEYNSYCEELDYEENEFSIYLKIPKLKQIMLNC